jgi:hypothetical protein
MKRRDSSSLPSTAPHAGLFVKICSLTPFARECAGLFYNRRVPLPPGPSPDHAIRILQEFPKSLGLDADIAIPLVLHPAETFPWASFFDSDPTRRFVIFTDSRGVEKEWKGFGELTRLILEDLPDSRVAWCAGVPTAPDFPVPSERFLNLTGCPFEEMLALARQPSVFIGNDSGPMHLSAAVGNRVLAIFGPTAPERFGPWPPESTRTLAVRAPGGNLEQLPAATVRIAPMINDTEGGGSLRQDS